MQAAVVVILGSTEIKQGDGAFRIKEKKTMVEKKGEVYAADEFNVWTPAAAGAAGWLCEIKQHRADKRSAASAGVKASVNLTEETNLLLCVQLQWRQQQRQ